MKKSNRTLSIETAIKVNAEERIKLEKRFKELKELLLESSVEDSGLSVGDHIKLDTGVVVLIVDFWVSSGEAKAVYRCYDKEGNIQDYNSGSVSVLEAEKVNQKGER